MNSPAAATAMPVLLGLAAAVVWGAADFAGGLATRRALPGKVIFVAHGISLVLLAGLVLALRPPALSPRMTLFGLLSGVSGGIGLMLFYEALALGAMGLSAAVAGVLTAAVPVAVSVVQQGRPGAWQLAGFAVAAMAIVLIAYTPAPAAASGSAAYTTMGQVIGQSRGHAPGLAPGLAHGPAHGPARARRMLALAVLAGLGFGMQLVVLHIASEHGSVVRALMLSRAGGTLTGAAAMLLGAMRGRALLPPATPEALHGPSRRQGALGSFVLLAALAGILDTAGNGLYMGAALVGRLDVAAVLASLYPGATILLAAWLLHERTTRLQTAGMLLALVAVALISA